MRNQRNTTYRVTWTFEVDALSAEAAAGMVHLDHCDTAHFAEATEEADGSKGHATEVDRPRVKTYTERLTENTAALRTHG